ncbi:UDP-glycosyltransferase 73B4-like [Magnolia sinica]|uniref:UDP-glycosyltransferase 73B4-like n=1 Tax=Magnolia sinica TaxID=86752 RepID=UPI0026593E5E|nr:UDP-glycosyltransferase 73B4-like [Magnolia sinica]
MKVSSVIYVSFGSVVIHSDQQLLETAFALEASGHPFIWVVKRHDSSSSDEAWLPIGFEERMKGKGLIIRGWAPQVVILNHPSIGAFVTHCGWNSVQEGVHAGLPMITWPSFAEQFWNEKLITDVLKIGAGIGVMEWVGWMQKEWPFVKREDIEKAIRRVMDGGEEADGMRKRAKELGKIAKGVVDVGGSSYNDLTRLIEELKTCVQQQNNQH